MAYFLEQIKGKFMKKNPFSASIYLVIKKRVYKQPQLPHTKIRLRFFGSSVKNVIHSYFYKNQVNWIRDWVVPKFSFVLKRPLFSIFLQSDFQPRVLSKNIYMNTRLKIYSLGSILPGSYKNNS